MYRFIEPEVAGGLGEKTILDSSVHPPIVNRLEYVFDGWLGDDILETFPCFIFSERLKIKIESESLTGIQFDNVVISKSPNFDQLDPTIDLPMFYWGKITGKENPDDFVIGDDFRLMISESAFALLALFNIEHALIESV